MVETLNELAHLRNTGFGQPQPRHGLRLLYWFANDCISFERNDMLSECDPANGDFGFHCYENRYDQYGKKLLPGINFPYYVVGNLNSPGAEDLPDYVLEDEYTDEDNSNTDRIVISLDEEGIHRVYVTQHNDRSNYDPDTTYRISRGLLMIIRRMSLQDFLVKMGYCTHTQPINYYSPPPSEEDSVDHTVVSISSSEGYITHTQPIISLDHTVVSISSSEGYITHTQPIISLDHTVVSISSSDSSDSEFNDDTPAQNNSEDSPATLGLWERFCTIL